MTRIDRKIQPMPLFEQPFGGELGSYASDLTLVGTHRRPG